MRTTTLLAIVFGVFCVASLLSAQDSSECSTDILSETEKQIGLLKVADFHAFFEEIDPRCKGDIRFMGWVNDLLFRTLESQPSQFIDTFDALPRFKQRIILDELSAPAHDGLDASRTYERARDASGPVESKQRILQALTKAGCRCDTDLIQ